MKVLSGFLGVILLLLATACGHQDMAGWLIPEEEARFAQEYLQRLRERDLDYIKQYVNPSLESQATDDRFAELAEYFPRGELLGIELIGSQTRIFNSQWEGNFSFEYRFSDGWAIASILLERSDGNLSVLGINVQRTQVSQKDLNRFILSGKSGLQYLMLALALSTPVFVLVTLYACIRTPMSGRKWLWILFILVGVGSWSVNWTTGQMSWQVLSIHLLSASAMKAGAAAPWIISVSFPMGAMVFWFRRERLVLAGRSGALDRGQ